MKKWIFAKPQIKICEIFLCVVISHSGSQKPARASFSLSSADDTIGTNSFSVMKAQPLRPWQQKLHTIVFEADTPAGKLFDVIVITSIVLSVAVVMLESVSSMRAKYGESLKILEWFFTILFSIEYILRLISVGRPIRYVFSFFWNCRFACHPSNVSEFDHSGQSLFSEHPDFEIVTHFQGVQIN